MRIEKESHAEFHAGHGTVGTTAQKLADFNWSLARGVKIKADLGNTNNLFIGHDTNVTSSNGFVLDAGEEVEIKVDMLDKVFVIADAASQGYSWVAI